MVRGVRLPCDGPRNTVHVFAPVPCAVHLVLEPSPSALVLEVRGRMLSSPRAARQHEALEGRLCRGALGYRNATARTAEELTTRVVEVDHLIAREAIRGELREKVWARDVGIGDVNRPLTPGGRAHLHEVGIRSVTEIP